MIYTVPEPNHGNEAAQHPPSPSTTLPSRCHHRHAPGREAQRRSADGSQDQPRERRDWGCEGWGEGCLLFPVTTATWSLCGRAGVQTGSVLAFGASFTEPSLRTEVKLH